MKGDRRWDGLLRKLQTSYQEHLNNLARNLTIIVFQLSPIDFTTTVRQHLYQLHHVAGKAGSTATQVSIGKQ